MNAVQLNDIKRENLLVNNNETHREIWEIPFLEVRICKNSSCINSDRHTIVVSGYLKVNQTQPRIRIRTVPGVYQTYINTCRLRNVV